MIRKIYFRADADATIGYGHFIRLLSLAAILKDDFECVFVTQTPTAYQKNEVLKICELIELPADNRKFAFFLDMLTGSEIVVLDNYFYNIEYQRAIKEKGCKLICIDDRSGLPFYADIVINHVLGIESKDIINLNSAKLLLGTDYALLRPDFIKAMQQPHSYDSGSNNILVAMGGTDYSNMTWKIANLLISKTNYKVNLLLGDSYKFEEKFVSFPVNIYRNIAACQLVELIKKQKMVICAPSTQAYEVCAVGCILMVGSFANNHFAVEKKLADYHLATSCGKFSDLTPELFLNLFCQSLSDSDQISQQRLYFDGKQPNRFLSCFKKLQ